MTVPPGLAPPGDWLARLLGGVSDDVGSLCRALEGPDPPRDALERIRALRGALRRAERALLERRVRQHLVSARSRESSNEAPDPPDDVLKLLVRSMQ